MMNSLLFVSDHNQLAITDDEEDQLLYEYSIKLRNKKIIKKKPNYLHDLNDMHFYEKFRFQKATVLKILDLINDKLEFSSSRNDTTSLSPMNQLLLTLRYYATGSFLIVVGDFSGVHKSTASRTVHRVTTAIAELRPAYVKMPTTVSEIQAVNMGFYNIASFPRVIGAIDCTHVKIQSPGGADAEVYRNRKGYFSYNVQTISDHSLKILDVVARWPGSTHDSTIFENSRIQSQFELGVFGNNVLLCDSGYACKPFMIPPLRHCTLPEHQLFNESQIRTRNVVERQYGVLKRRFPVLAMGIRLKKTSVQGIIVACAVLHNIAIMEKEQEPPEDSETRVSLARAISEGNISATVEDNGSQIGSRNVFISYFRDRIRNRDT